MRQEATPRRWREIDQLVLDWKGASVYDNPADALRFGTVAGSYCYLGYDGWREWAREHYVGADTYDHATGRITHPKLREFFDKWYPDFEEQQHKEDNKRLDKDSRNYKLYPDGAHIRLELNRGAGADYFSPNKEFFGILDEWHVSPFYNNGRLQTDYWKTTYEARSRAYLYDIAVACYTGMVRLESFGNDFSKYLDWKNTQGLTVDHLDGNPHNNTVLNLVLMPATDNFRKQQFPAGFVQPYALIMAYVNEEFRIQLFMENTELDIFQELLDRLYPGAFTLNDGAGTSALRFVCEDSDSLVKCIKYLYEARYNWCNPTGTARDNKRAHRDVDHLAADIRRSMSAQSALALMDRSLFQPFTGEGESNELTYFSIFPR